MLARKSRLKTLFRYVFIVRVRGIFHLQVIFTQQFGKPQGSGGEAMVMLVAMYKQGMHGW